MSARKETPYAFFLKHAGWEYKPGEETPEQGRRRCARALADAEKRGKEAGLVMRDRITYGSDGTPTYHIPSKGDDKQPMSRGEIMRECFLGGPGLSGYAYNADTYCESCAYDIVRAMNPLPEIFGTEDPLFADSETLPQPSFFAESDTAQHCGECGGYLYGESDGDETEGEEG